MKELQVDNSVEMLNMNEESKSKKAEILENALLYLSSFYRSHNLPRRKQPEKIVSNMEPISGACVSYADLPTSVQLQIFTYVDVMTLCRAARVSRMWSQLAGDDLLWEKKLRRDSHRWEVIDHLSHPQLYAETGSELSPKEIYLQCCPECRRLRKSKPSFPIHFPRLTYMLGISIPRIAMFGSGLDASGLVSRVLWDERSPFTVKGMFPGQFEGVGSGVCLQHDGGSLNLITLHSMPEAERDLQPGAGERRSRLLLSNNSGNEDEEDGGYELTQPLKELCTTIDGFIYVVNSREDDDRVTLGIEEFCAMIDDRWVQAKAPVLVVCCVDNATVPSISALHVANKLKLLHLTRPWQVRQCHVNSLYGFGPGVEWLMRHVIGL